MKVVTKGLDKYRYAPVHRSQASASTVKKRSPFLPKTLIVQTTILFVLMAMAVFAAHADKIIIAADKWCPMNCTPGSDREGYMVDIAKRVFSAKGHEVEYKVMPWSRTIEMVRSGSMNGAVGPCHEDCPDCIFPQNELAKLVFSVFVKKESAWRYTGVNSLDGVRVGVAAYYAYGHPGNKFDSYVKKNMDDDTKIQVNYGNTPVKDNIKMLLNDRVDAVIATPSVFADLTNELNLNDQFKAVGVVNRAKDSFIAFSPALPSSDQYAKILSEGVEALRATGELQIILSKYDLVDWKI